MVILEEKTVTNGIDSDEYRILIRLVKEDNVKNRFRIEVSKFDTRVEMVMTFWERLRYLFNKKKAIICYHSVASWLTIRTFTDDDPKDPYVENCAREAFDYLTKEI